MCQRSHFFNIIFKPKAKSVSFTGTNCIGGYTLLAYEDNNNKSYCHCDLLNTNVLFCEENQDSVIIKVHYIVYAMTLHSSKNKNNHDESC